ncbi:hypothetical protein DERF_004282 [Dermatophagoides farinae]|uniref:Uncharacterized protein n=1 Tax=Dermatophagoides farinae TaxID=6954 RepID=A0A922I3G8_DERFA|nr:hypothetical protein DERF_004282 [Dermatophagoides farinae]
MKIRSRFFFAVHAVRIVADGEEFEVVEAINEFQSNGFGWLLLSSLLLCSRIESDDRSRLRPLSSLPFRLYSSINVVDELEEDDEEEAGVVAETDDAEDNIPRPFHSGTCILKLPANASVLAAAKLGCAANARCGCECVPYTEPNVLVEFECSDPLDNDDVKCGCVDDDDDDDE